MLNFLDGLRVHTSVQRIGDFCNPNPVQYFHCVIQSEPNPVVLSQFLIQFVLYPRKNHLIFEHFGLDAVMNLVWNWISISDPVEFFQNPACCRSGSE